MLKTWLSTVPLSPYAFNKCPTFPNDGSYMYTHSVIQLDIKLKYSNPLISSFIHLMIDCPTFPTCTQKVIHFPQWLPIHVYIQCNTIKRQITVFKPFFNVKNQILLTPRGEWDTIKMTLNWPIIIFLAKNYISTSYTPPVRGTAALRGTAARKTTLAQKSGSKRANIDQIVIP